MTILLLGRLLVFLECERQHIVCVAVCRLMKGAGCHAAAGTNVEAALLYDVEGQRVVARMAGHEDDVNAVGVPSVPPLHTLKRLH